MQELIGIIANDPLFKTARNGVPMVMFQIEKDGKSGQVVSFGNHVKELSLTRGDTVKISGDAVNRKYINRNGDEVKTREFRAETIEPVGKPAAFIPPGWEAVEDDIPF